MMNPEPSTDKLLAVSVTAETANWISDRYDTSSVGQGAEEEDAQGNLVQKKTLDPFWVKDAVQPHQSRALQKLFSDTYISAQHQVRWNIGTIKI
jgi:hypothetical protein